MNAEKRTEIHSSIDGREDAAAIGTVAPGPVERTPENSFYPTVERWRLPESAVAASYAEMAADGQHDREGIALWAGVRGSDGVAEVTHVIILRGDGVLRYRYFIGITPDLLNDVTDELNELGVSLVGQIHSHPPDSTTDLSPTDIRYGIAVPGYLSVVAPDYAANPAPRPAEWGVHVYEPSRRWRRMSPFEALDRVEIVTDRLASLMVVGATTASGVGDTNA